MAIKLSNIVRGLLVSTGVFVLIIILFVGWVFWETSQNCDHFPEILASNTELVKISKREYEKYPTNPEATCSGKVAREALEAVAPEYKSIAPHLPSFEERRYQSFCNQYEFDLGKLYLIKPTDHQQYLVLDKGEQRYELISKQIMFDSPVCNASTINGIRINDNQVIFTYSGFENPKKYLKLLWR